MKYLTKFLLPLGLGLLMVIGLSHFFQASTTVAQSIPENAQVIQAGLAYIQTQQQGDGGITGFSGVSDPDTTARSVLAFVTAGKPVSETISADGKSMLDYLAAQAITFTHDTTGTLFPGRAGLLLTSVSVAGGNPSSFGGMDLAGELEKTFQQNTGTYNTAAKQDLSSGEASDVSQAWAILGLSLANHDVPEAASQYLNHSQAADGSWGSGDPDTTALVVTAMIATRKVSSQNAIIQKALQFFHDTQVTSGGWKPTWDTDPLNADSTGWVLEALVSAGEDVRGQAWMKDGINPVDALLSLQKADGAIGGTYANTYSTAEAIIGLSGIPLSNLGITPTSNRAGLAIFFDDNSLFTTCISYTENSFSGLDLLQRSGLAIETATNPNQGTAVCKIGEVGSPSDNCFGSMPNYWSYWQLSGNEWAYSVVGADQSKVEDGGVDAWSWGTGNPPPVLNFQNLCEGVAYILPTSAKVSTPSINTPQSSPMPSIIPATQQLQPTAVASSAQTSSGSYIVYASILLVLGLLVIYLIRSRSR